jgi:type II secretory pathway pseudopilin PulG
MKAYKNMNGEAVPNHRRRKGKKVESDLAAYNQTLKQQRQQNDRNHHIPINTNTECKWTSFPHQKTPFDKLD